MASFVELVHPIQLLSKHASQWCQTTIYLLQFARSFGCPPLCLSILPPTSFLRCAIEDWLMPTNAATLWVETPLLNCTKAWCFYSWDNGGIQLQTILQIASHILWNQGTRNLTTFSTTMHTKTSMLEEWRRIKENIVTLTTSTLLVLEILNPFHFLISHLCN